MASVGFVCARYQGQRYDFGSAPTKADSGHLVIQSNFDICGISCSSSRLDGGLWPIIISVTDGMYHNLHSIISDLRYSEMSSLSSMAIWNVSFNDTWCPATLSLDTRSKVCHLGIRRCFCFRVRMWVRILIWPTFVYWMKMLCSDPFLYSISP